MALHSSVRSASISDESDGEVCRMSYVHARDGRDDVWGDVTVRRMLVDIRRCRAAELAGRHEEMM